MSIHPRLHALVQECEFRVIELEQTFVEYAGAHEEEISYVKKNVPWLRSNIAMLSIDHGINDDASLTPIFYLVKELHRRLGNFARERADYISKRAEDLPLEYLTTPMVQIDLAIRFIISTNSLGNIQIVDPFSRQRFRDSLEYLVGEKSPAVLLPQIETQMIEAKKEYDRLFGEVDQIKGAAETARNDLGNLREKYNNAVPHFDRVLGRSNQAGLVTAWREKEKELLDSQKFWFKVFAGTLMGLAILIFVVGLKFEFKYPDFIYRLPMTIPFVWLAWFSAKQHGYTNRLREDYSFKVATALAFEGYKKEAERVDDSLLKDLMKSSIGSFSDHPLRIFSVKSDAGAPVEELINLARDEKNISAVERLINLLRGTRSK